MRVVAVSKPLNSEGYTLHEKDQVGQKQRMFCYPISVEAESDLN